jgi:general secretion pathway protein I
MRSARGFTLLEMIVATTIMAVAIVGLLSGLSGTTRNAARLRDYDRAVQLGRERMNELMLDLTLPHNSMLQGVFDPNLTGGVEAGWKARLTTFALPPVIRVNETALDRLELEVWWKSGDTIRTFTLDAYRPRAITNDDAGGASGIQGNAGKEGKASAPGVGDK